MESSDGLEPEIDFSPVKKKRYEKFTSELCVFCHKNESVGSLGSGTVQGLIRVKEVCKLRLENDPHDYGSKDIEQILESSVKRKPKWHRQCYQQFTNKSKLDKLLSHEPLEDSSDTESEVKGDFGWHDKCLFSGITCQIISKKAGVSKVFGKSKVKETLLKVAEKRNDSALASRIASINLVDKKAWYHRKCYQAYTSERNINADLPRTDPTSDIHDMAFSRLVSKIDHKLFFRNAVYDMSKLLIEFRKYLKALGTIDSDYPGHRLKERLLKHYGDRIQFKRQTIRSKPLLVMANTATEVALTNALNKIDVEYETLYDESDNDTDDLMSKCLFEAATILRSDLKNINGITMTDTSNLNNKMAERLVPDSVYAFLHWLINGSNDVDTPINKDMANIQNAGRHESILSIGQDLLWAVSNGRQQTAKHIGLAMTVKHLTGSKQLISVINKFGHCASYPTIQRFETGLAIDYVNRMSNDEVILPSNIFPGSFVQAAADNNDFQEETIDGKMTTHATSLVLYQRKIEPNVNQMPNDIPKRVRERSLKDIDKIRPKLLSLSNTSRKPSTTDLFGKVDLQWFVNTDCAAKEEANLLDNAWILARMCPDKLFEITIDNPDQVVPSWTAFNISVATKNPAISEVGYCPMIPAQASDMSTIYTVLDTVDKLMYKLDQRHAVLTFDEALYSKAKEVQWRMPDKFKNLVLRLGGFHTIMVFLAAIGKRFRDSGLEDALIDCGVYAGNTVEQIFRGKHYNRGVRAHKMAMEAFARLRWLALCDW